MRYSVWGVIALFLVVGAGCTTPPTVDIPRNDTFDGVGEPPQKAGPEPKKVVLPVDKDLSLKPVKGVLDYTANWDYVTFPGEEAAWCKPDGSHGAFGDQCYDTRTEKLPMVTMDFQIPNDMCRGYYSCRVINNSCTTVLVKQPWDACYSCYETCKNKSASQLDSCVASCTAKSVERY